MYIVEIEYDYCIYHKAPDELDTEMIDHFIDYSSIITEHEYNDTIRKNTIYHLDGVDYIQESYIISDIALKIVPDYFVDFGRELIPSKNLKYVDKKFMSIMIQLWKKYEAHNKTALKIEENLDLLFDMLEIQKIIE